MTTHEIADMIFAIKEKLTDSEYKDIMEKLAVKHTEEKKENLDIESHLDMVYIISCINRRAQEAFEKNYTEIMIDNSYLRWVDFSVAEFVSNITETEDDAFPKKIIELYGGVFKAIYLYQNILGGDFEIEDEIKNNYKLANIIIYDFFTEIYPEFKDIPVL